MGKKNKRKGQQQAAAAAQPAPAAAAAAAKPAATRPKRGAPADSDDDDEEFVPSFGKSMQSLCYSLSLSALVHVPYENPTRRVDSLEMLLTSIVVYSAIHVHLRMHGSVVMLWPWSMLVNGCLLHAVPRGVE